MNKRVLRMTRCALFTCILCVFAQLSIALPSLVPITLQTFAIYILALCLSPMDAFVSTLLYVVIGAIGIPVFSGMTGGMASLVSPAGGFIWSFPIMALVISLINSQSDAFTFQLMSLVIGTVLCYGIGLLWFMYVTQNNLYNGFIMCVLPFLLGDFIKIFISLFVAKRLKTRIKIGC